ncbi:sensor histidine kinase [Amycolatopsis acidicola]|nr:histidine kinase [Amycolatopsis acidicola]
MVLARVKARIEESCAEIGLPYPWWIPLFSTSATVVITIGALVQRHALFPPTPMALGGLVAIAPLLLWVIRRRMMLPLIEALIVSAAAAILLLQPASVDFAPFLLMVMVAEIAAVSPLSTAFAVTALGVVILVAATVHGTLIGLSLYVVGLLLGLVVGIGLRWQARALEAERANQDIRQQQAVSEERQHIAREVHDVIGHSLSITLLHVTGARHALQHDRDIAEAVEALEEAERVGRTAMGDIRRSVGLLADGPAATAPVPGIEDVATLVERTRAAGVDVRYRQAGDLSFVDMTHGLSLYRIAQESLANIAKHAATAAAEVHLDAGPDGTRLTVRNTLLSHQAEYTPGAGLNSMTTRAGQLGAVLHAGPRGEDWVVDVTVPLATPRSGCPIRPVVS